MMVLMMIMLMGEESSGNVSNQMKFAERIHTFI